MAKLGSRKVMTREHAAEFEIERVSRYDSANNEELCQLLWLLFLHV